MRVALNAQLLSTASSYRTAGISRVIYQLLANLRTVPSGLDYLVYAPEGPENYHFLKGHGLAHRLIPDTGRPAARIAWEQLALPLALRRDRADVVHAMGFVSPCAWRGLSVVTAYDLSFLRFPEVFNRANRLYLRHFAPSSFRRASRVIAISEHTRRDVIELCGVPPERVTTIYLAADERFQPAGSEALARFRADRDLTRPFVLYLGTLEPRKNVITLVRAYHELRRQGAEHALVLAGGRGWQYEPIFELVQRLGLEQHVMFPGFIPPGEQALWYSAADVFAFPSLYEGFGLPLLEAMACGTPVVASNSSSLPEVVGEAGILAEPTDVAGFASALTRVLEDEETRARLRAAGLARARTFSWRKMAEETVQVYHEVLRAR